MSCLYFNNAFSKQPLPEAVAAMTPFLRQQFENPLTDSPQGESARSMLEAAHAETAALLHARPEEIVLVSSGTEANNLAVKGAAWAAAAGKRRNHIILSAIEHFSVFQAAAYLGRNGFDVSIVPVSSGGLVDPREVARLIRPQTALVSISAGSDEIGVVQDLAGLSAVKADFPDVLFHTDAVQYLCYRELDVRALTFDLVSFSSNAIYGPPGVAALYIREGARVVPMLHGGMQEGGLRPGLQSMALVAGFGAAAAVNRRDKQQWARALAGLQRQLYEVLSGMDVPVTGSTEHRLVDNIHAVFDVDGEALLALLLSEGIRASTGSTCYQFAQKESHVLKALGIGQERSRGAVLFTTGVGQTGDDVRALSECLQRSVKHLRSLKPV